MPVQHNIIIVHIIIAYNLWITQIINTKNTSHYSNFDIHTCELIKAHLTHTTKRILHVRTTPTHSNEG